MTPGFSKRDARWLVIVGVLVCGLGSARAQQFSADLTTKRPDGTSAPAGKLRVYDSKVRIETPDLPDGFFLIDGAKPTALFVRPAACVFMEARQSSLLTRLFVPVDPGSPCPQWQAMARDAGIAERGDWRCERLADEAIVGHIAAAYRAVSPAGQELLAWIDPIRKFPVQIKTEDGTVIVAQNIRDDRQPAQMFEVPSGFRKFDPQALLRRIKQSDVWVARPDDLSSHASETSVGPRR
jgi:hypothetical protein